MKKEIYIDGKLYKAYDQNYYVSEYGDVWSIKDYRYLKHFNHSYGRHGVHFYGKNWLVHRLVYHVFIKPIDSKVQINHRDDNKDNNHYTNLYAGNQRDNALDRVRNGHHCGYKKAITVYDKELNERFTFPSIADLVNWTGHNIKYISLKRTICKKWFKERYELIDIKRVTTNESYKTLKKEYEDKVAWITATRSE